MKIYTPGGDHEFRLLYPTVHPHIESGGCLAEGNEIPPAIMLGKAEISSSYIGDLVMNELKQLDHIAYIRFASVYREFRDIETFKEILDSLTTSEAANLANSLAPSSSSTDTLLH